MLATLNMCMKILVEFIAFLFKIPLEEDINISYGNLLVFVVFLSIVLKIIFGSKNSTSNDSYQPKHVYQPKHGKKR